MLDVITEKECRTFFEKNEDLNAFIKWVLGLWMNYTQFLNWYEVKLNWSRNYYLEVII
jgi:hypothetical protein